MCPSATRQMTTGYLSLPSAFTYSSLFEEDSAKYRPAPKSPVLHAKAMSKLFCAIKSAASGFVPWNIRNSLTPGISSGSMALLRMSSATFCVAIWPLQLSHVLSSQGAAPRSFLHCADAVHALEVQIPRLRVHHRDNLLDLVTLRHSPGAVTGHDARLGVVEDLLEERPDLSAVHVDLLEHLGSGIIPDQLSDLPARRQALQLAQQAHRVLVQLVKLGVGGVVSLLGEDHGLPDLRLVLTINGLLQHVQRLDLVLVHHPAGERQLELLAIGDGPLREASGLLGLRDGLVPRLEGPPELVVEALHHGLVTELRAEVHNLLHGRGHPLVALAGHHDDCVDHPDDDRRELGSQVAHVQQRPL
mmetsp:Transcript_63591/g.196917  ORF Transcript_63591/g.196917 Transcript_63591/m.196917 type:complete len:359 (-) Transcript_63591:802-1878(-)